MVSDMGVDSMKGALNKRGLSVKQGIIIVHGINV